MVANKPYIRVPFHDGVIGAEVTDPQERLSTQLDSVGHEVEHGNPDRSLYQHGQATRERAHAILTILRHHGLLLLHLVFRFVVLGCGLLQLRLQHTHLGRAHIALLHHGIGDYLQQQRDQDEHDTHGEIVLQEVENIEREESVDIAEQRPSQVHQPFHLQILAESALLLHLLQQTEIIGTIVELKLRGLLACWVKSGLHLRLIVLQVARAFLLGNTRHERAFLEIILSYHHGGEELVLECHPIDGFLQRLVYFLTSLAQVVCSSLHVMISQGGVAALKSKSPLLLTSLACPLHVHLVISGSEKACHALGGQVHVEQVILTQPIFQGQIFTWGCLRGKSHRRISHLRGLKI